MDEIDNCENEFSFPSGDSFTIGEQFAPLIVDIFSELSGRGSTLSKGE